MVTNAPPISPPPAPPRPAQPAVAAVAREDRVLEIPPPPGRREKVVNDATGALRTTYAAEVAKARETIEKYGLTIEVTRLRDRLDRSVGTDLQRLLLATPGVPELLFNEAIAQQLAEEEQAGKPVKDESVVSIATKIESASSTIQQALSAINESTKLFQESTQQIVRAVDEVARAIKDKDEYPGGPDATEAANPPVGRGRKTSTPKIPEEPGS